MHANTFIATRAKSEQSEQAAAVPWFTDLCAVLGVESPTAADPSGQTYAFQKRVNKSVGGLGFADAWKKGCFAWEFKGRNADLNKAYLQLLAYAGDLENPPLLVVSTFDQIIVRSHFTNAAQEIETFSLDDLLDEQKRERLRSVWLDPEAWRRDQRGADSTT